MASNVYLSITGTSQGEIRGDSTVTSMNREGTIEAFEFEHTVQIPTEVSGMATGQRSYSPIKIVKRIDRSSPLLHQALCNNEELEITIKFYRPNIDGDGTEEQYYTIRLRQARVSSIKTISPNTINEPTSSQPAMEEVSFVFGTINWTYEREGIEHEDEWRVAS
jgi:type VI secretion system secreted protein Hcp